MKKEKVTIENYQELAMRTCLPSAKNWSYAVFGLDAEYYELLAKMAGFKAKKIRDGDDFEKAKYLEKIKDEIGDCFWFIALKCELREFQFAEIFGSGKFGHDEEFVCWLSDVCDNFNFDINEILQRNIDKLASRAERGVIKGNGDSR